MEALTRSSAVPAEEKESMIGAISRLRRESIGQAGRRLVRERLGARVYGDQTAEHLFSYCYRIRSTLVHGNPSAPASDEVGSAAVGLEALVSDLLTSPFLGLRKQ